MQSQHDSLYCLPAWGTVSAFMHEQMFVRIFLHVHLPYVNMHMFCVCFFLICCSNLILGQRLLTSNLRDGTTKIKKKTELLVIFTDLKMQKREVFSFFSFFFGNV